MTFQPLSTLCPITREAGDEALRSLSAGSTSCRRRLCHCDSARRRSMRLRETDITDDPTDPVSRSESAETSRQYSRSVRQFRQHGFTGGCYRQANGRLIPFFAITTIYSGSTHTSDMTLTACKSSFPFIRRPATSDWMSSTDISCLRSPILERSFWSVRSMATLSMPFVTTGRDFRRALNMSY